MKLQIVQEEYEGIPQTPEVFTDEQSAFDHFEGKVISMGFRAKYDNETVQRYLERYNEWFSDHNEQEDPIRWWEIDLPTPLADKMEEALLLLNTKVREGFLEISEGVEAYDKFVALIPEITKKQG